MEEDSRPHERDTEIFDGPERGRVEAQLPHSLDSTESRLGATRVKTITTRGGITHPATHERNGGGHREDPVG